MPFDASHQRFSLQQSLIPYLESKFEQLRKITTLGPDITVACSLIYTHAGQKRESISVWIVLDRGDR